MPPALEYPDLVPPRGWTYQQVGSQVRLHPPEGPADAVAIVLAPLLARHPGLPPPEQMLGQALDVEAAADEDGDDEAGGFQVSDRGAVEPFETAGGLRGLRLVVRGQRRGEPPERRVYLLLTDEVCHYGVSYVAREEVFEQHLPAFVEAARSLRPFAGHALAPPAVAPAASPMGNYED